MDRGGKISARLPVAVQLSLVVAIAVAATFLTDDLHFRSPVNALWMVALPAVLAFALNDDVRQKVVMTFAMIALSVSASTIAGVFVIGYP